MMSFIIVPRSLGICYQLSAMRILNVSILWLSLSGCAAPWVWAPATSIKRPLAAEYPSASMVLVTRESKVTTSADTPAFTVTRLERHDIVAVLRDELKYVWFAVPASADDKLVSMKARIVDPRGQATEVTPEPFVGDVADLQLESESGKLEYKFFRFPKVEVGSLIEYVYATESPGAVFSKNEKISLEVPILHFHLELSISKNADYAYRLHNVDGAFRASSDGDMSKITLDLYNIKAAVREPFSPPWSAVEPWWAYRLNHIDWPGGKHYSASRQVVFDSWASTMKKLALSLYVDNDTYYKGAPLKIDVRACKGDVHCIVDHAMSFVRDKTELTELSRFITGARSMTDVLRSGKANNFEKALLLWGVLKASHVTSYFGLAQRDLRLKFENDFPRPIQFDHLIVVVPQQAGIAAPLVLDPACEHCAVGQVLASVEGHDMLVLEGKPQLTTDIDLRVELVPVKSSSAPATGWRRQHDVKIDQAGTLNGRMKETLYGLEAVEAHLGKAPKEAANDLRGRDKRTLLRNVVPQTCDRLHGECHLEVDYSVVSYAAVDGDSLTVPLTFMASDWDTRFRSATREHDVFIRYPSPEEEILTFHLPAGYEAVDLPPSRKQSTPFADFELEVTSAPGVVTVRRAVTGHPGIYPKADYSAYAVAVSSFGATRRLVFRAKPIKN